MNEPDKLSKELALPISLVYKTAFDKAMEL